MLQFRPEMVKHISYFFRQNVSVTLVPDQLDGAGQEDCQNRPDQGVEVFRQAVRERVQLLEADLPPRSVQEHCEANEAEGDDALREVDDRIRFEGEDPIYF